MQSKTVGTANSASGMRFYSVDLDFKKILLESKRCYHLWKDIVQIQAPPGSEKDFDPTLSKNAYSLITLSSPLPEYYKLWQQVFKNIRKYPGLEEKPIWIHTWLNVHRSEHLGAMSLGWHSHNYCSKHGFIHLSQKDTDTVFSAVVPEDMEERDRYTNWYIDAPDRYAPHELDDKDTMLVVPNKQGMQYIGPGSLMHKVRPKPFDGIRVSIGYDIMEDPDLDDPSVVDTFQNDIFVPIPQWN
jgi:hypothetical protein